MSSINLRHKSQVYILRITSKIIFNPYKFILFERMLTQIEFKVLDLVYTLICKSFTAPFCWENGSMVVKQNQNVIYNYILWFLLLSSFVLKTLFIYQNNSINDLILNGIFFLVIVTNIIFQLTVWLYQTELVQFINEILHINSCWGQFKKA